MLFEQSNAIIYGAELLNNQWGEAISTAIYLKNRSPTKLLPCITYYKLNTGSKPDLCHLHIFGCFCYH